MSRRRDLDQARVGALASAGLLVGYLRAGGIPQPFPCSIRLDAGESCYGEGMAGLSQYFAVPSPAPDTVAWAPAGPAGSVVTLDRRGRTRISEPRWQPMGFVPLVATSRRLMACQHGRWLSWWYSGVRQLVPDVGGLAVSLLFDQDRPTRFEGTFTPWLSVLLTHLLYGEILDPGPVALAGAYPA